ncbi:MAG: hypothetical protein EA425_13355 [Puniceicoccaceae bacterium]|nr:MAG: hypothetical protein EA425_13355 [Puniceicoccaceae bacterium]
MWISSPIPYPVSSTLDRLSAVEISALIDFTKSIDAAWVFQAAEVDLGRDFRKNPRIGRWQPKTAD